MIGLWAASLLMQPILRAADDQVLVWAQEVMLGCEYGKEGSGAVRLWESNPVVAIEGGDAATRTVVLNGIADINAALSGTSRKLLFAEETEQAPTLTVHLARMSELPGLAESLGFHYPSENAGAFWAWWNSESVIYRAHVLLATDLLHGDALRHFTLEEISQSLGLVNDSACFADSIFFEDGEDGGDAMQFSKQDRWLLQMAYTRLKPGDRADAILRLALPE